MDKLEQVKKEIKRLKEWQPIASPSLNKLLSFIDSLQEKTVSKDFEMALAEMIDNAQKNVIEPWVVAAQWKDELIELVKSEEPANEKLEEAARRYAALQAGMKDAMTSEFYEEYPYSPNDVNAFMDGAKWQKEQMTSKE